MSYQMIDALVNDGAFSGRVGACCIEQAEHFAHDDRPAIVALARRVAIGRTDVTTTFLRLVAAAPGIADKAGNDVTNQNRIPDADILAAVQAFWPVVADLYYTDDGQEVTA
jgi:hypothetical protein